MTVGVMTPDPLISRRAELEIQEGVKLQHCQYDADDGSPQMQFRTILKMLRGAGERNGETFTQFWTFAANGEIGPNTKTGQMLDAALRGDAQAESLEELAARLPGKRFAAEVTTSKNGLYSNVKHDTISPAPEPPEPKKPEPPEDPDDEDDDFDSIPF